VSRTEVAGFGLAFGGSLWPGLRTPRAAGIPRWKI